jgi:MraZ protein
VADRGLFRGHALQGIDAKGRVGIPAPLRATIERNGGGQKLLLLGVNDASGCLTGADTDQSQIEYERMEREQERALEQDRAPRLTASAQELFGIAEDIPFDASGRFILPVFNREEAGLTDWAFFIGRGDHFEIWDPQRLIDSDAPDIVKRAVRSCLAQKGVTL